MSNACPSEIPAVTAGDGGEWVFATADGLVDVRLHGAVVPRVPRGADVATGRRQPDPSGRLTALRHAPTSVAHPAAAVFDVALPEIARPAGRFPLAALATTGVTAVVAATFFSPIFALLAGVSAIAVVGRWGGAVVAERRSRTQRVRAECNARDEWHRFASEWVDAEASARRTEAFTPDRLAAVVRGDASPWWQRLGASENIDACVGFGSTHVEIEVEGSGPDPSIIGTADRSTTIDDCPIPVEIAPGIGVCGDRADALAAARWLVASTLTRIGPADLGVVLVTTADRVDDWDQLKWSTALHGCVVVDVDRDDELAGCLDRACRSDAGGAGRVLVIVDGAEPTSAGVLARVLSGRLEGVSMVWVGSSDSVPAGCRSTVMVDADASGTLATIDRPGEQRVRWFGCDDATWSDVMRWLGRFDDPEAAVGGQGLEPAVALSDLVVGECDGPFVQDLLHRWSLASTDKLVGAIGLDPEGPVELDLVADGPHVLAAGTTGSGKSELLRTLVVGLAAVQPPDVVSFVLIDFKGGGAFDAVAALPHVAAVVTDLDPSEAGRALRGLRAEILDREHRLRDMGISDVSDVDRGNPRAFGRMVVVVDEFASLADELPEFLDGLVDIARRGRSLGVHLVLATQRPSGVVTGQIRANTNLRLCLRVQDRGDSVDVVDDVAAALLPSIPGRAVIRRGGGRCRQLQVAHVGGVRRRATAEVFRIHRSAGGPVPAVLESLNERLAAIGGPAEAPRSLVARIVDAGAGSPRAVAPWRQRATSASFPVVAPGESTAEPGAIGLIDDPDRRTIEPLAWCPAAGGLLVVGNDESRVASTAAVAVAAALDRDPSTPLFVIDGDRSGSPDLAVLSRLEPCVDIIGVGEPERLARAVDRLELATQPQLVVINHWSRVSEALADELGPLGPERLIKLARRAGAQGTAVVVTARTDRDVPQRAAGALGLRIVHRLADPAGYASFGLRPDDARTLEGAMFVEPSSGLVGVAADLGTEALDDLAARLDSAGVARWPEPIRVLGARVDRAVLPRPEPLPNGWRVPVGLDVDLDPHWIVVSAQRPVVVVGHPGGGRTTAVTTVAGALGDRVCVIDDADVMEPAVLAEMVARAKFEGRPIVVGSTPSSVKRFGSTVAELVPEATTVMLNPGRSEGELVRSVVPDLTDQPVGRAVAVDRGRVTVIQVAA